MSHSGRYWPRRSRVCPCERHVPPPRGGSADLTNSLFSLVFSACHTVGGTGPDAAVSTLVSGMFRRHVVARQT
eukprot:215042-Pelagomonas_calceolata.AAC.1